MSMELVVLWLYLVLNLMGELKESPLSFPRKLITGWRNGVLSKAMACLPLKGADRLILGKELPFFQEGIRSLEDPSSTFWDDKDVLCSFQGFVPPTHFITGWYDFFLETCL